MGIDIITLTVKLSNGTQHIITFPPDKSFNMTVIEFKTLVADTIEIPANMQRVVYKGKVLKDDTVLSTTGIESGHTVHVVRSQPHQNTGTPAVNTTSTTSASVQQTQDSVRSTTNDTPTGTSPLQQQQQPPANPFASLFGSYLTPANPTASTGSGGTPGAFNIPGTDLNGMNAMTSQLMQNPAFMQSVTQVVASNPALFQNLANQMLASQNFSPTQQESMTRMVSDPNMISLLMNTFAGGGQTGGAMPANPMQQQSTTMATDTNNRAPQPSAGNLGTPGTDPQLNLNQLAGLVSTLNQVRPPVPPGAFGTGAGTDAFGIQVPSNPREAYAEQLSQLQAMGFPNEHANIQALIQAHGIVERAVDFLIGG